VDIIWVETDKVGERMGHGVMFVDARLLGIADQGVVSVVRGFQWGPYAEFVYVEILPPGAAYSAEFLADARVAIEQFLLQPHRGGPGPISPMLTAYFNA